MKYINIILAGFLLLLAGCSSINKQKSSNTGTEKAVTLTVPQINLGNVKANTLFDKACIELKNNTNKKQVLYYITTGVCPCILAVQNNAVIPPNGTIKIKLSFTPRKDMIGEYSFKVTAYMNNNNQHTITIPVTVNVENPDLKPIIIERFLMKGCNDCKKMYPVFDKIKKEFPNVVYKDYYSDSEKSVKYIHDKCIELNIPKNEQMDAPTIFIGNKFLINKNITYSSLEKMIRQNNNN